jgi:hypothetical protein
MSRLEHTVDMTGPLMALVQSAEQDVSSSREELERLVAEAQEALGSGPAPDAAACSDPGTSAELVRFWAGVLAQLDIEAERLATRQREVLALVDAALERTRQENDAVDAQNAQTRPGVWEAAWKPPVLAPTAIEEESDDPSLAPSDRQRLARVLLVLGSTLIGVALLLLVV